MKNWHLEPSCGLLRLTLCDSHLSKSRTVVSNLLSAVEFGAAAADFNG
jgi:hypothetical protein